MKMNPYFKTLVSLALLVMGLALLAFGTHDGVRATGFLLAAGAFISTMVSLHET